MDESLVIQPLHAFTGPNGAGKSEIIRALRPRFARVTTLLCPPSPMFFGYLHPGELVTLEHPWGSVHPAHIPGMVKMLREWSASVQVIIETCNPLILNELLGDEITVVTRHPDRGQQTVLLQDTFNYRIRSRIYANGELWLAHCDGDQETELIQGPTP